MNIYIKPIHCAICNEETYQQVYDFIVHSERTCTKCWTVSQVMIGGAKR